ncbi:MAG: beta-galactosidase [Armatimonadota bacterium]
MAVVLAFAVLLPAAAQAQSATARREGSIVSVGGRPTVLMWALGLSDGADIEQYQKSGLNTVYLRIGDSSAEQLDRVSRFASAAEQAGLNVVFSLAPRPLRDGSGNEVAIDPVSDDYATAVEAFVNAVVDGVGEHPKLIAWAFEVPAANVVNNDDGFVSYLQDWYSSVGALNDSWGTEYEDWSEVTLGAARDVDADNPQGLGRASLDYSYYRQSAYSDAMDVWVEALKAADPGRLVFAGEMTDFRSLISAPADLDGMVLALYPSTTDGDWDSHDVHGVDIARRAGQFAAVQTLETSADSEAWQLTAWAGLALAHGATGVAFSSWQALRDNEDLQGVIEEIQEVVTRQGYPEAPAPQAAILYEPFAGGAEGRAGSLYGYLEGFAPGTPTNLFAAARDGSRYGLLDVLGADSLPVADLSQYGAILAPMAFYLTIDQQMALQNYVLRGGALVVDLGVGMYQADGTTDSMPAIVREMLGMRYEDLGAFVEGQEPAVDVGEVYDPANPTAPEPLAPGQEGKQVDPALTRFVQSLENFLTRADVAQYLGDNFMGEAAEGFRVNGLGEGFAVYAPDFLYENWDDSNEYFNEFHDRVLANRSGLEIIQPDYTWPGVTATFFDDGSVGVASPSGDMVSVLVSGANNQVYLVPWGATRLSNGSDSTQAELLFPGGWLGRARPLPIWLYPTVEGTTATMVIKRYGRDGIQLVVAGDGASERLQDGEVVMGGGSWTQVEIDIKSGVYPIAADSVHKVTMQQGGAASGTSTEVMPDTETGALVINASVADTLITIEQAG